MSMINLFNITVEEEAIKNVEHVLRSTWLNEGEWVKKFEEKLTQEFNFQNITTTNSCTSALHLALICSGVQPGDEVILPPQTFIATGTSILTAGAKPVFVDIDPNTGNINPNEIKNKINNKTKAIIVVHWGGNPCLMDEIHKVANGLPIIEDAAHALGAYPICIGDYTCFSFQTIKFLTTGDGGAICVKDTSKLNELRRRKWFGFDKENLTKHFEGDRANLVSELGFKYHMNNIAAAIGLGNLKGIQTKLNKRRSIANIYYKEFKNVKGLKLLKPNGKPSYWIFTMRVENRKSFISKMKQNDIEVSVLDRRIDKHPIFQNITPNLLGQEKFDEEQISIPVHDALSEMDLAKIVNTIKVVGDINIVHKEVNYGKTISTNIS